MVWYVIKNPIGEYLSGWTRVGIHDRERYVDKQALAMRFDREDARGLKRGLPDHRIVRLRGKGEVRS